MSYLERGTPLCSCQDCQWWCQMGTSQPSSQTSARLEPTSQHWSLERQTTKYTNHKLKLIWSVVKNCLRVHELRKLVWSMIIKIYALISLSLTPVLTVVFSSEDLRCNVVGCSTESTGGITWSDPLLSGRRKGKKCKSKPNSGCIGEKVSVEDMNMNSGRNKGRSPVSTCSQYWSTALLITLHQLSTWWTDRNQCLSYLAHAIVCELDVSLMVQEDVVQLQVTVDDALFVKEVQGDTDFCSIKSVREEREMCLTIKAKVFHLYTRKY